MKIFIYPLLAALLSSCGTSKETTATSQGTTATSDTKNASTTTTQTPPSNTGITMQTEANYRLIVSFISIGEGIDTKARENMDFLISKWKTKNNIELNPEVMPWGREGEVDYGFKFNELKDDMADRFINEVKSSYKDNNLVQIFENQPAPHKR